MKLFISKTYTVRIERGLKTYSYISKVKCVPQSWRGFQMVTDAEETEKNTDKRVFVLYNRIRNPGPPKALFIYHC